MSGWIRLHREIRTHWIYDEKPFSKYKAWTDILLSANYSDNKFLLGNELIDVKRGSFVTSEIKLMERWGWSKTKLRDFLKLLQNENMIIKVADKKKTTITVVNYEIYQSTETTEEPQENQGKTTKKPRKGTNKNDKNRNNISSSEADEVEKEPQLEFSVESIEYRLADFLRKWIKKNNPKSKVPDDKDMDRWSSDIDKMIRLDNRNLDDIKAVIEFSQKDEFWMGNILSTTKLRKQFDQLYIKSQQKNKTPTQPLKRKTKFHLEKSRGDKYGADELEQLVLNNQKKRFEEKKAGG